MGKWQWCYKIRLPAGSIYGIWGGADNTVVVTTVSFPYTSVGWQLAAVGDFDGDGYSDFAFQHDTSGAKAIWLLSSLSWDIKPNGTASYSNPPDWRLTGAGDFGSGSDPTSGVKDGKDDLVLTYYNPQNDTIGVNQTGIWFMDGLTLVYPTTIKNSSGQTVVPELPDWRLAATGTFDADNKTDAFIRDAVIGRHGIWYLSGYVMQASEWVEPQPDPAWKLFSQDWLQSTWRHKDIYPAISGYASSTSPLQFTLSYRIAPNDTYGLTIRRRVAEGTWSTLVTGYNSDTFIDTTSLTAGVRYEYEVKREGPLPSSFLDRYLGRIFMCESQPISLMENRGKILLIVDATVYTGIAPALDNFVRNLIGDGWSVAVKSDAPRTDNRWLTCSGGYKSDPLADAANEAGRNIVKQFINSHPDAQGIILIGHVTIPRSGTQNGAPDGHANNSADAMVADLWYGHSGNGWTDSNGLDRPCHPLFPANSNVYGDGKYHNDFVPSPGELSKFVGRIDFARLPEFGTGDQASSSEIQLLINYFNKNHNYRATETVYAPRATVLQPNNLASGTPLVYSAASKDMTPLFGSQPDNLLIGDPYHQKSESFLWGFLQANAGVAVIAVGVPGSYPLQGPFLQHRTFDLVDSESKVAFYQISGSYLHNWSENDSLMRATIATSNHGLAVTYGFISQNPNPAYWKFHGLAFGEPLGQSLLRTIHDGTSGTKDHSTIRSILGDPTLRMHVIQPPYNPYWSNNTLYWGGQPGSQFYIYHAPHLQDTFTRIAGPLSQMNYSGAPTTGVLMLRAARPVNTGSGSFTQLSQGAFVP